MQKGADIDYESYAKSMRAVLSGSQICLPDKTLNHQYFNAKKGFYWSEDNQNKLLESIKTYGKDWKKISTQCFKNNKSEVQLEMRACILYKVKDASEIIEYQQQVDVPQKKAKKAPTQQQKNSKPIPAKNKK